MALDDPYSVKVLENCQISPPPNSVQVPASLPLTFFDIMLIHFSSVKRVYFYEYPNLTPELMNTNILPLLKHSLSLTLQQFFPLAGNLVCPPHPSKAHLLYIARDSVQLTIAESTADFTHLVSNYPRNVKEFHSLVPELLTSQDTQHLQVEVIPCLALQVTFFPNFGISIGITYSHAVADGRTFSHFMKSWATVFKSRGDLYSIDNELLPFYDKSVIKDSKGLDTIFWNQWWTWKSFNLKEDTTTTTATATATATATTFDDENFRATFIMGQNDIERLKQWLLLQCKNDDDEAPGLLRLSTFVVTCAFIWVCLVKSLDNSDDDDDTLHHFTFVADCRNRDEINVPMTYFGNCLKPIYVLAKRGELVKENGIVVAAKAIGSKMKEFESGMLLEGAESWMSEIKELLGSGRHQIAVAGSPKLCLYETDFGWGKPKKIEVLHFDLSGPISLTECRDEEGGIEVGLALGKVEMEAFISIFEQGRRKFSSF